MGRQIIFYQLESDLNDLLSFLDDKNLLVFDRYGNKLTSSADLYTADLCAINKEFMKVEFQNPPIEFCVPMPLKDEALVYSPDIASYEKINIENMNVISDGRFYLPTVLYENEELVSIYNLLVKYIKKKYTYSKQAFSYFSPAFIESYKKGNVFPANGRNIRSVDDI